ncbi:MAG: cytochrome c oxidase subunit 3 [Alphaproteobacteria bacterium]|nr:cytochrome c oxidase subunit 3 [Alphaproteobacteria bacterium]
MAETHARGHDYHLVDPSPWPALGATGAFITAVGGVWYMHEGPPWIILIGLAIVAYTMFVWWRDVIREAVHEGHHTPVVQLGLRYGMVLFIASEVMFFVAWFWAYFNAALFPTEFMGSQWPPKGVYTFDPWHLPLMNTLILLLSSTTVTWAHHAVIAGDRQSAVQGLVVTVLLGLFFTAIQAIEYSIAPFEFATLYGSRFFMATGFHGFHVMIGTAFLIVCLFRTMAGHFKPDHHFGLEAAAWYWHFVDVVWVFLFSCIYVWGLGPIAQH